MSQNSLRNLLFFTAMTGAVTLGALDGWKNKNSTEAIEGLFLAGACAAAARHEYGPVKAAMNRGPPPLQMTSQNRKAPTPTPGG